MPTDGQPPFDTRDLLIEDSFDDPESGWGIGNTPGGDIAYGDGTLQFSLPASGNWIWSRRNTGDTNGTLRLVGFFEPQTAGSFALLCASGEDLYGAMISSFGGFAFVRIGDEGAEELDGDPEAGLDVPLDGTTQLVVECAGTNTGSFKMQAWLRGTGPLGIYEADEGPQNFDRAAAYVEAESDAHVTNLADIFVFGVTGPDGQRDEAGDELWSHVPSALDDNCYQSPVPALHADQATANLVCFTGEPGDDGVEVLEYTQFDSPEEMNVAYQARVDSFGTGEGTESCRDGSGEHPYQIGEEEVGRVLCIDQTRGIRFDWTDTRLNVLASAVDFDGDYGATYDDWINAGPNP